MGNKPGCLEDAHMILPGFNVCEMKIFYMKTHKWANTARWDRVFFDQFFFFFFLRCFLDNIR